MKIQKFTAHSNFGGIFLSILAAIAIIAVGQTALHDIAGKFDNPRDQFPYFCTEQIQNINQIRFPQKIYQKINPKCEKIFAEHQNLTKKINNTLSPFENTLRTLERKLFDFERQKNIADATGDPALTREITRKILALNLERKNLTQKIKNTEKTFTPDIKNLNQQIKKAETIFRDQKFAWEIKILLASLAFALPLLILTLIFYRRRENATSHMRFFWLAGFIATTALTAQIFIRGIWQFLPRDLLAHYAKIIYDILTRTIFGTGLGYFFILAAIFTFFGFLIWLVQTRIFSPTRAIRKAMRERKCHNCNEKINPKTEKFCWHCGTDTQKPCPKCKKTSRFGATFCENCGKKFEN